MEESFWFFGKEIFIQMLNKTKVENLVAVSLAVLQLCNDRQTTILGKYISFVFKEMSSKLPTGC